MTEKDITDYLEDCNSRKSERKIICLETLEVFDNATMASQKYSNRKYRTGGTPIINSCKGKNTYAYTLEDGTHLHWMFYNDYLQKIENNEPIIIEENPKNKKMVICLTTNKIFETIELAGKEYDIKSTSRICQVCKGVYDYAGKLPDGTPLRWMYYEDFLKLPQEEQNEILARNKELLTV